MVQLSINLGKIISNFPDEICGVPQHLFLGVWKPYKVY